MPLKEFHIQVGIVDHLKGQKRHKGKVYDGGGQNRPFKNLFVSHIYQGRSEDEGFFLKMLGVSPGIPDLICIWENGWGFLEVKTIKGCLSEPQKKFRDMCERLSIKWALVRTVTEAHNILIKWGLTPMHNIIHEAYDKQAVHDAFKKEMYKND